MLIKTVLKPSPISGLGLFSVDDIAKDTCVWEWHHGFDMVIPKRYFDSSPESVKTFLLKYAVLVGDMIYLCADDARFVNHSNTPNICISDPVGEPEIMNAAMRDILAGEELTIDYATIDQWYPDYKDNLK